MFIIKAQMRLIEWRDRFNLNQKVHQRMHSCLDKASVGPSQDAREQEAREFVSRENIDLENYNPKHRDRNRQDCEHSNLELCDDRLTDCERGDVPGWVLVVLMTTGLVTAIWTIAAPRLSTILRNSLDAMNGIR